jgi:hypothetical protein
MKMRTVGAWVGFVLAAGSLTGCAGSGANSNFQRTNPAPFKSVSGTTPTAATGAAAPASSTAWTRNTPTTGTKPVGDPSALAAPTGNTPQFNSQPSGGITPVGGIAPPAPLPGGSPVPAAQAIGASTSNLLPAAPAASGPLSLNTTRATEAAPRSVQVAAGSIDDSANGPAMPTATSGSDIPVKPPEPIRQLSPVAPVTLPPTTVRQ